MKKKVICVYAPSSPAHIWFEEKYLFAKKQLEDMGFEIVEGNVVKNRVYQGYRTASAKERAEEMMNLVKNKDIDIMMPVIGGYNSGSLLPYLDFDEIEKSKKKLKELEKKVQEERNKKLLYEFKDLDDFKKSNAYMFNLYKAKLEHTEASIENSVINVKVKDGVLDTENKTISFP